MKQLLQNISTGKASVVEVPAPRPGPGEVLVRVQASLVSAGTERSVLEFTEKNLLQKAIDRPDLVRQVLEKAGRDGVLSTLAAVRSRLDNDMALGYSNAGTVIEVGGGVGELQVGDRVACAGGGFATHAEVVRVPRNLVAHIPAATARGEVDFEEAAFATVGTIALQGLRLARPELGEVVAVIGLGLVGLLTVQLARAAGCAVIGMDPLPERCRLAERLGCRATAGSADEMAALVAAHSAAAGADAVLITAATTSNDPVQLAGEIARDRGRIVAVGAVGMDIPRRSYYAKELSFQVSRSGGPGRYDPEYEEKGRDYPVGYVRWTEGRNLQAFLQLLADGRIDVRPLITHRFRIDDAAIVYSLISGDSGKSFLGVVIVYPEAPSLATRVELPAVVNRRERQQESAVRVGLIGAGNFARATLLPAMKSVRGLELAAVCAASGASAHAAAARFGFRYCATDETELLGDASINTVAIATRHHHHASAVIAALGAGKHVFCEKPLCISEDELVEVTRAYQQAAAGAAPPLLMVGYNRRFAPLACEMAGFLRQRREPLLLHYRINAGPLPASHWVQDIEQGGGRIIGEVCHFVDFLMFLSGAEVISVYAAATRAGAPVSTDNLTATLQLADGSVGTITYSAHGDRSFPKERIEVAGGGAVAVLDDFRRLEMVRDGKKRVRQSRFRQDKGHRGEWEAFAAAIISGSSSPISWPELVNSTLTTLCIPRSLSLGMPVVVDPGAVLPGASGSQRPDPSRS